MVASRMWRPTPSILGEPDMQAYLKAGLVAVLAVVIAKRIPGVRDYL